MYLKDYLKHGSESHVTDLCYDDTVFIHKLAWQLMFRSHITDKRYTQMESCIIWRKWI